jgi:hypothetical protein
LLDAAALRSGLRGLEVLIVVPDDLALLADGHRIIAISALLDRLRRLVSPPNARRTALIAIQPPGAPSVFVSMPFSDSYVDTFKAIRKAAHSCGLVAVRVDHDAYLAVDVVSQIKLQIGNAAFVLVDVSELRPNVLHEYGYAEGHGKPVIAITSTGVGTLPFNIRNNVTLSYVRGNSEPLRRQLTIAFKKQALTLGLSPTSGS